MGIPYKKLSKKELDEKLLAMKKKLLEVRTQAMKEGTDGKHPKMSKAKGIRKIIARILTAERQNQLEMLKKEYKGKKVIPKVLRPKLPRTMRKPRIPLAPRKKSLWEDKTIRFKLLRGAPYVPQ